MNPLEWYAQTSFHKWWVDHVWRPSWTKFTAAIYGIPALLVSLVEMGSKYAQDNTIQSYLGTMDIPNWVPVGLAGLALIHYIASGRE